MPSKIPDYKNLTTSQLLSLKATFAQKVGYSPSKGQALVHSSCKRFRVVCAGARFGKSMLAGFEMAFFSLFPDFRIWSVAPVYELAEKEFNWALEFLSKYKIPDGRSMVDLGRLSSPSRGSRSIIFPHGSYIRTKSTEKPDTLLGEELDFINLGEASCIPREVWERQIRARIGSRNGMLLAPSTGSGDSGLFAEMIARGKSGLKNDSDWESWEFSTIDNPTFSQKEYFLAKRTLPREIFEEQYEGKLVSRRGFVFSLNKDHILNENISSYENCPCAVSVQYGFKNPCSVVFFACLSEKNFVVIDEIYQKETLIKDIIDLIKEKTKGRRVLCVTGDYFDSEVRREFEKNGLRLSVSEEKNMNKSSAIQARVRLLQDALSTPENQDYPCLRFLKGCKNTIDDFNQCKWGDKPKEISDKLESELPLPKYFQSPQAISYFIKWIVDCAGTDVYSVQKKRG